MRNAIVLLVCLLLNFTAIAQKEKAKNAKKNPEPTVEKALPSSNFSALAFRSIGPAVTSGRIADFAVNPNNHSEYYVAAASAGVWKTTNRGVTFEPIFEGEGSYSIGCVTLDPTNAAVVWVGSGENNNQRSVAYGDGVYKSTDGGKSWKNMGLKNSEHIAEVIVHPGNSNIVYVAAYGPVWSEGGDRGVYKSTDGGQSWTCVKSVSSYTGCNDLVIDPRDPNVLYAAFHQRMRKVFTYIGGGPESAVYKSTDGGSTWTKLEGGLPSGDVGRIGLAVSKVNPDMVYAVVEANEGRGGIFRSTDRGASWEKRSGNYTSGNYYNEIECDPFNANKIYITDTYYKVSYDGGKSVSNLGEINKHIDNHAIWVDPSDANHMLVGCDGGVYETYDHAGSWHYKANLPVTQFYKVSTDNAYPFYNVHGGTQDNLSLGGPSRSASANGIVNSDWFVTSIGDGFETQVDQNDPNIIYAQSQYGGLIRYDHRNGEYLSIKPIEGEDEAPYRWNWDAPLVISKYDNKRLYFGANKVFRTDDQGNTWKVISPDLSRQIDRNKIEVMGKVWSVDAIAKNGSTDIYGQTTSISESPLDASYLWVGTDDGLIQLTTDGGKNWTKFDNLPGVPTQSYVHQIIASQYDKNTAYVCFNHHRYGDFKPYVLKTTDAGKTWTSISSDLPERGSVYSIAEDHVDPSLLFVGTEFGCFFTYNGGKNWVALKAGLPTIAVRDIEIQKRENDLVLATFGRGFYVLDDYSSLRNINKEMFDKEALLFPVKDALMYIERLPLGLRDKGHMGSSYYSAPNPKPGAVFTYYLKDDVKKLKEIRKEKEKKAYENKEKVYYPSIDSLRMEDNQTDPYLLFSITDARGNTIRHLKASAKKGSHRLVWDMRYGNHAPVQNRYTPAPDELFGAEDAGHLVMPGKYTVTLYKVYDGTMTQMGEARNFECKLWNNGTLQTKDLAANVAFCEKVTVMIKATQEMNDQLAGIESKLKNVRTAVTDMPAPAAPWLEKAHVLQQEAVQLKTAIFGDAARAKREFETAPTFNDRIGGLVGTLWNSTAAIPGSAVASLQIAEKQYQKYAPQVKALNQKVEALILDVEKAGGPFIGR